LFSKKLFQVYIAKIYFAYRVPKTGSNLPLLTFNIFNSVFAIQLSF